MAWFSSRGPRLGDSTVKPDVVAPGVSITAARAAGTTIGFPVDDNYTDLEGTSMATPHVAGLAAIVKQRAPDLGRRADQVGRSRARRCPSRARRGSRPARVESTPRARSRRRSLADPSLDLGFYPYPQGDLEPEAHASDLYEPGKRAGRPRPVRRRAGPGRRRTCRGHAVSEPADRAGRRTGAGRRRARSGRCARPETPRASSSRAPGPGCRYAPPSGSRSRASTTT